MIIHNQMLSELLFGFINRLEVCLFEQKKNMECNQTKKTGFFVFNNQ